MMNQKFENLGKKSLFVVGTFVGLVFIWLAVDSLIILAQMYRFSPSNFWTASNTSWDIFVIIFLLLVLAFNVIRITGFFQGKWLAIRGTGILVAINVVFIIIFGTMVFFESNTPSTSARYFDSIPFDGCRPDLPTVSCVYNHPEFYGIASNVTVTGKIVKLDYIPPIENLGKTEFYATHDEYSVCFLYLDISDGKSTLSGCASSKGEVHEKIIQYMSKLHIGDTVTVTGEIYPGFKECGIKGGCTGTVANLMPVSINGVDINSYMLPWDVPKDKKPKWFVGKGLTHGEFFKYTISHGIFNSSNLTQTDSLNVTINVNEKNSTNIWSINLIKEKNSKIFNYNNCTLIVQETRILCTQQGDFDPEPYTELTILFLGKYAYEENTQVLYPLMTNWAKITDFDAISNWLDVYYDKKTTINGLEYNATVVGWNGILSSGDNTQFVVVDNFPFPVAGRVYKLADTGPDWHGEYYDFKLLDTNWNNISLSKP